MAKRRKQLGAIEGERHRFKGTFVRYGSKPGYQSPIPVKTLLLRDIQDAETDQPICDHVWFTCGKNFDSVGPLHEGDIVAFDARSATYNKGYVNWRKGIDTKRQDHKLSNPTKVVKLDPENES